MTEVKRSISINLANGESIKLELSKATAINTEKEMIHLDKLPDGSWRLIYNENLIPDFSKVIGFTVDRENPVKYLVIADTEELAYNIAKKSIGNQEVIIDSLHNVVTKLEQYTCIGVHNYKCNTRGMFVNHVIIDKSCVDKIDNIKKLVYVLSDGTGLGTYSIWEE